MRIAVISILTIRSLFSIPFILLKVNSVSDLPFASIDRIWSSDSERKCPYPQQGSKISSLDVGDAAVEVGDLATVFGLTPGGERVPVEKFAEGAGTIGYEILVGIGQRVQRRTTDGSPPESARK